jgi:hypothetical protein
LLAPTNGQVEGELNLADLINIDDDVHDSPMAVEMSPASAGAGIDAEDGVETPTIEVPQSPLVSQSARPTGISPFAVNTSQPDLTIRPSFDLNSVWSAPVSPPKKQEDSEQVTRGPNENGESAEPSPDLGKELELKDPFVDDENLGGAAPDDKDFDMFLEAEPDADSLEGGSAIANPTPDVPAKEPTFDELPQVWLGSVSDQHGSICIYIPHSHTFTDALVPRCTNSVQHASRVQYTDGNTCPRASNGRPTTGTRFAVVEDIIPIDATSD